MADEDNDYEIGANIPGNIVKLLCSEGEAVTAGQPIAVIEAMKMETTITAPMAGIVEEILVREGSRIESGDCLLRIEDAIKR